MLGHEVVAVPLARAGATIRRTKRLPRALESRLHQRKGINMIKVNETHVHAFYKKVKVIHYFRFAAEGLIFFLLISISHILGKVCRNLV